MCLYGDMCMCEQVPMEARRACDIPGAGVQAVVEHTHTSCDTGNQTQILGKSKELFLVTGYCFSPLYIKDFQQKMYTSVYLF